MCDEVACGADALQDAMQLEIQHGRSRSKGRSAIWASVRVPRTHCSGEALVRAHPDPPTG